MRPAHERLSEQLKADIIEGRLAPGSQIPGEMELAEQHGVSRTTVRRALDTLTQEGLVNRHQGRGTFVSEGQINQVLGDLFSFTEIIQQMGMEPGITGIRVGVDPYPPHEAREFLPGGHLWIVERVRTGNGKPVALMRSWLPDAVAWELTPESLQGNQSLYEILREKGVRPARTNETILAEAASENDAALLDIAPGSPLLTICRWASDASGRPIEYVRSSSPGDRYRTHVWSRRT